MTIAPDQLSVLHRPPEPAKPAAPQRPGGTGQPPAGEQPEAQPQRPWEAWINRDAFVNLQGSDTGLDSRNRPLGTQENEKTRLSNEIREQYKRFLTHYVRRLQELQDDPTLLEGPEHAHDRLLIDPKTGLVDKDGNVTNETLEKFLSDDNPQNWNLATLALSHHASKLLYVFGVVAGERPQGNRDIILDIDNQRIRTRIGEGLLHTIFNDTLWPWMQEELNRTGQRLDPNAVFAQLNRGQALVQLGGWGAGAAFLGGLAFGPPGALAGAFAPTAITSIARSFREGVTIDRQQLAAAFEAMGGRTVATRAGAATSREIRFMSRMTGIQLDNYEVTAAGTIGVRAGFQERGWDSPTKLIREAFSLLYTRQEFMTTIGIPYDRLDFMPEQFIFEPALRNPATRAQMLGEQTGFKAYGAVYDRYFNQYDNFAATHRRPPTTAESFRLWLEASSAEMSQRMQRDIDEAIRKEEREGRIAKIKDYKDNHLAQTAEKRKKEITDRKEALTKDLETSTVERASLSAYRTAIENYRREVRENIIKTTAEVDDLLNQIRDAAGNPIPNIDTALDALNDVAYSIPPPAAAPGGAGAIPDVRINGRRIRSVETRRAAAGAAGAFAATASDEIKRDLQQIEEIIKKLDTARRVGSASLKYDKDPAKEAEIPRNAAAKIGELQREFTTIAGWNGTNGISLSETDLRNPSIPMQELLDRINRINQFDATRGWSREQNNLQEVRKRLIAAMTEARARALSPALAAPGVTFDRLINTPTAGVPGFEMTEHEVLSMTTYQIRRILQNKQTTNPARFGGLGALPTEQDIELSISIAQDRLSARTQVIDEMERHLTISKALAENAEVGFDLVESKERYEMVLESPEKTSDIASRIGARPDLFVSTAAVNPADAVTWSEAERETYTFTPARGGAPVTTQYSTGYLEAMNLLFDYRKGDPETTNRMFRIARQVLPPDRLAIILHERVRPLLVVPRAASNDLDVVFTDLQSLIGSGRIQAGGRNGIRRMLEDVIDRVLAETSIAAVA